MVKQKSPNFELQQLRSSIIVLGSFDIAERFQEHLEQRFEGAIALTEGGSGEKILNAITKVEWLLVRFVPYPSSH